MSPTAAPSDDDDPMTDGDETPAMNVVRLRGRLTRHPEVTTLPSGDEVLAINVTVERPHDGLDTLPVQVGPVPPQGRRPAPGQAGRRLLSTARRLGPGDIIEIDGWLRRRWWESPSGRRSRVEVAATAVRQIATSTAGPSPE